MAAWKNLYNALHTKRAQSVDNGGPDVQAGLGLCCPFTESMDTVVYVNEQRMSRSDCIDAQADLDLGCLQIA